MDLGWAALTWFAGVDWLNAATTLATLATAVLLYLQYRHTREADLPSVEGTLELRHGGEGGLYWDARLVVRNYGTTAVHIVGVQLERPRNWRLAPREHPTYPNTNERLDLNDVARPVGTESIVGSRTGRPVPADVRYVELLLFPPSGLRPGQRIKVRIVLFIEQRMRVVRSRRIAISRTISTPDS